MAKSLFLFIISGLISVFSAPGILMADNFELKRLPEFNEVETIIEVASEIQGPAGEAFGEPKDTLAAPEASQVATQVRRVTQQTVQASVSMPANSFSINGKNLQLLNVSTPAVDAGDHVNRYSNMFYGHNSAGVFAGIGSAGEFTVTENGVTSRYRVMEQHVFEKYSATHLSLNGQVYSMAALANRAWGYDVIVVTCAGTSLGNGDATHRLVLFANKI